MVNCIFKLTMTIVLIQFKIGLLRTEDIYSRNRLEIWPNFKNISLSPDTPEESRTLICKGTENIQWYFRQYNGTLQIKKDVSIKVFPSAQNRYTYLALLPLSKATYLDTGYYICATSEKLYFYKEIYIYVQHKTHLLAIPEDFKPWYDLKNGTIFVPSRLTSADANVTMASNYEYLSEDGYDSDYARICHPIKEFRCWTIRNGTCIPDYAICDGSENCIDGIDEDEIMCKARTCPPFQPFRCTNSSQCLHNIMVCDGQKNCPDGSDEEETMCQTKTCHPYRPFKCANGLQCIPISEVCDGKRNCTDGSDEDKTTCQAVKMCDMRWQFKCTDFDIRNKLGFDTRFNNTHKACLDAMFLLVCNGHRDCGDGSDENPAMCQAKTCRGETSFRCTSGQCLDPTQVCNGYKSCFDGIDEDKRMCENIMQGDIQFNEKIGFQMDLLPFINISYTSTAHKNHITDGRRVPNPLVDLVKIKDSASGRVLIGQNLTINCSIDPVFEFIFWVLKWRIPDTQENEHERITKGRYGNGNVLLHIKNVSNDDAGDYICVAMSFNGLNYTKTYKLYVYPHNTNYINLKIDDGIHKKIRPAEYESVRWIIIISTTGSTSVEWRAPNGQVLETKSATTCENNNNCVSELLVTNLKLSDSGVYRLATYGCAELQEINVTLIVEEKPTILFIKGLISSQSYYDFGKNYTFILYISGYPLPSVECVFEKCPNYPICGESYFETKPVEIEITKVSEITIKVLISMNVTDTGTFICIASNILGNHAKQYTILVTDMSNGLEIRGPSTIIAGDNITIQCYASIYFNYIDKIKWNYPEDSQIQENITITDSETPFSYRSQLMIKNVTKKFNGYVNCTVNRSNQTIDGPTELETKSFEIYVEDPRLPVINNSSDENRPIVADYGEQVLLQCSAIGMPHPTITWFKEDQPWPFEGNYSRVLTKSDNQSLLINFTEIELQMTYKCIASNKIGSAVLSYTLKRNNTNDENRTINVFFFCSVIAILLGIIIIGCVTSLKKEKTLKNKMTLTKMYELEEGTVISENSNMSIQLSRWSFPIDRLELGKRLGCGAFGVVYKAKAVGIMNKNTTTAVAVKMINPNTESCCIKALETELKIMINIGKHLNIVNLLGLCTENVDKKLMIILEYCPYGNVYQYMRKHREYFVNQFKSSGLIVCDDKPNSKNSIHENVYINRSISKISKGSEDYVNLVNTVVILPNEKEIVEENSNNDGNYKHRNKKPLCTLDLIQWSYQVARGMDFLSSKNILHGDLATRNILLADENIVKICDFGLSKTLSNSGVYKKKLKKGLFPYKWMAIESIKDLVFSTQSDVWSFGIVMWEMFSLAATPYPNLPLCDLYDTLVHGYRMEKPKYANSIIYNMMMDCWEAEPIKRPSFADLTNRLGDLLQEYTKSDYANLNENFQETLNELLVETDPISPLSEESCSNCYIISENL